MRFACFMAAALLIAGTAWGAEHTKDSPDTVKANLASGKAILIDVREQREWDEGHLQDAKFCPLSDLRKVASDEAIKEKVEKALPKDRIIYCHCGSGVRVLTAAPILEKLGFEIRPLSLGFKDLCEAGFPEAKK